MLETFYLNGFMSGADLEILKRGVLYVGHHGWSAKQVLDFRWSKKVEITLETVKFLAKYLY